MQHVPSSSTESSTFDRPSIERRRFPRPAIVDLRVLRTLLGTLSLLLVGLAIVAVFPAGGLALTLVGFGILFALPYAIVRGVAGSLHPSQ